MKKGKIVFAVFLLCLVLPNLLYALLYPYIDTDNHENRAYAELPEFRDILTDYEGFTAQIEDWYRDRLPFKNQLKRMDTWIQQARRSLDGYQVTLGVPPVTIGKENWLFYTTHGPEDDSTGDYIGENRYTAEELEALAESYGKTTDYFASQGMEFVLLIPPGKEQIYSEYMPDNFPAHAEPSRAQVLTEELNGRGAAKAVYPKEAILRGKERAETYHKYDSHWNPYGAFLGVQEVLRALGKETTSPDQITLREEEGGPTDLVGLSGAFASDFEPTKTVMVEDYHPEVQAALTESAEDDSFYHYVSNAADQRSVLVLRDSFGIGLLEFLPKEFGDVVFLTEPDRAAEYCRAHHPDIVILEIAERFRGRQESWQELLMQ